MRTAGAATCTRVVLRRQTVTYLNQPEPTFLVGSFHETLSRICKDPTQEWVQAGSGKQIQVGGDRKARCSGGSVGVALAILDLPRSPVTHEPWCSLLATTLHKLTSLAQENTTILTEQYLNQPQPHYFAGSLNILYRGSY